MNHWYPFNIIPLFKRYLVDNIDWFETALDDFEDDYLIIDCPGQIELYTHFPIMKNIVSKLQRLGYSVCGVYLLDSQFVEDTTKFFAGVMSAMSAMIQLEIPHINVMTKMDLLGPKADDPALDRFFEVDGTLLVEDANAMTKPKFHLLNQAIVRLVSSLHVFFIDCFYMEAYTHF